MIKMFIISAGLLLSFDAFAQLPSLSPQSMLSQDIGSTNILVKYGRPAARGRTIFGSLVPYASLWRTGAGSCTKIKFNNSVVVSGRQILMGSYSLFSIPGP